MTCFLLYWAMPYPITAKLIRNIKQYFIYLNTFLPIFLDHAEAFQKVKYAKNANITLLMVLSLGFIQNINNKNTRFLKSEGKEVYPNLDVFVAALVYNLPVDKYTWQ